MLFKLIFAEFKHSYAFAICEAKHWLCIVGECILIILLVSGVFCSIAGIHCIVSDDIKACRQAKMLAADGWCKVDVHKNDFISAELLARNRFEDKFDKN